MEFRTSLYCMQCNVMPHSTACLAFKCQIHFGYSLHLTLLFQLNQRIWVSFGKLWNWLNWTMKRFTRADIRSKQHRFRYFWSSKMPMLDILNAKKKQQQFNPSINLGDNCLSCFVNKYVFFSTYIYIEMNWEYRLIRNSWNSWKVHTGNSALN